MPIIKNSLQLKNKIFFGASKLIYLFAAFYATLFFVFIDEILFCLPIYVLAPLVLFAFALPILLFPLLYDVINSSKSVALGRYHLPLAISVLGLGVFSGLLFSIELTWGFSMIAVALFLFITLSLTVCSFLLFVYTTAAIGSRYCEPGDMQMRKIKFFYVVIAALIFSTLMIFIFDGTSSSIRQCAYCISCVTLLSGLSVYLSSAAKMPHYLRELPAKSRSLTLKYSRFFVAATEYENARFFLTLFLYCMPAFMIVFATAWTNIIVGLSSSDIGILASCTVISAALTAALFWRRKKSATLLVFVIALPIAAAIWAEFFYIGALGGIFLFSATSVFFGISIGAYAVKATNSISAALKNCDTTKGKLISIINLVILLSFVTAFSIDLLFSLLPKFNVLAVMATAGVFLIVGLIITLRKKMYLTLEFPQDIGTPEN